MQCDDEQNYGFQELDSQDRGWSALGLHIESPKFRLKRELTQEEIESLIY